MFTQMSLATRSGVFRGGGAIAPGSTFFGAEYLIGSFN